MRLLSVEGESTERPSIEVIVSPAARPAFCAASPGRTLPTVTPEPPDAPAPGPKPKKSPPPLPDEVIATPRKAVAPTCTVEEAWPETICSASLEASSIGIAYAAPVVGKDPKSNPGKPAAPAVIIPTTLPSRSTSGPPESPGWMFAFTWIRFESCSLEPPNSSVAVIDWSSAVTDPPAYVGVDPVPPALPTPTTASPTESFDESPIRAVGRPEAPWS